VAERIGLDPALIRKARQLVDADQYRLDKLLNRAAQELQRIQAESRRLEGLLRENEKLKREMELVISREKSKQQVELLKHRNQITQEKFDYLKDMERKLRAIVVEWKKSEDREALIKTLRSLLFKQRDKQVADKQQRKFEQKYIETGTPVREGDKVRMPSGRQVGKVTRIRGKKAVVQVGSVPITVDISALVVVQDKVEGSLPEDR